MEVVEVVEVEVEGEARIQNHHYLPRSKRVRKLPDDLKSEPMIRRPFMATVTLATRTAGTSFTRIHLDLNLPKSLALIPLFFFP